MVRQARKARPLDDDYNGPDSFGQRRFSFLSLSVGWIQVE
jgi:hypothetical protein